MENEKNLICLFIIVEIVYLFTLFLIFLFTFNIYYLSSIILQIFLITDYP